MELPAYESRSSVNDIQLVTRVVAGDAAAERDLYETYVDRIFRLTFRLAGDDERARDFTQATFIRAFEKIGSFRGDSSLSMWLHSIGVSVAPNGLRKTKRLRNREAPMEDGLMVGAPQIEAEPDLKTRLARAIDSLCGRNRFSGSARRPGVDRRGQNEQGSRDQEEGVVLAWAIQRSAGDRSIRAAADEEMSRG